MKYIKTYENNKSLYKKYIVTDFSPYHDRELLTSTHYIFRVSSNSTYNILYYNNFYYINDLDKKLKKVKSNSYYVNYKNIIFDIIYQTNTLKDASDMLYTLQDTTKYNL